MKTLTTTEAMSVNGGKTYNCPFCWNHKGGYWDVYWHALTTGCFKKNKTLKSLWEAGRSLIKIGKDLSSFIK